MFKGPYDSRFVGRLGLGGDHWEFYVLDVRSESLGGRKRHLAASFFSRGASSRYRICSSAQTTTCPISTTQRIPFKAVGFPANEDIFRYI